MWRTLLVVLGLIIVLAAAGCGSTSSEPDTAAAASSLLASASPGALQPAALGETVTVGPLKITPTRLQQPSATPDPVYPDTSEKGTFCSVFMRWENVSTETVTDFPMSVVLNAEAESYGITMAQGPTPSLAHDWTELAPKAVIEGWLTFDMAGDAEKLVVTWRPDEPGETAVGTWSFQ